MHNYVSQFREAIQAAGLTPPTEIEADGKLRRFSSNGVKSDDAGWYLLHGDGVPAGSFGDWRTGLSQTWRADIGRSLTPDEEAEHRAKADAMRREREAEDAKRKAEARDEARQIWAKAEPCPEHPYLTRKRIEANGARLYKGRLVIPMRDGSTLHSVQFIGSDGEKRFLTGGRVSGCYYSIGNPKGAAALCIAEGFATGATIHEATGYPVAVAFNAGNLGAVAQAMRDKFPDLPLIVCADDDHRTEGNPGLTNATEVALSVGGKLAIPDFGPDRDPSQTDFNDMATKFGLEAVARAIAGSIDPARGEPRPVEENPPADDYATAAEPDDNETVLRLARLSPLNYDRIRGDEAKAMGVRPATLDKQVANARKAEDNNSMDIQDVDPWPHPVVPARLLTEIEATIRRFIVCDRETAHAATLWTALTWLIDDVQVAPLAVITAPEKRCGKSQLLFVLGRIVRRPLTASNVSAAALFRAVDAWRPTLLVDEADAFMRENEELRGILNAGHTRESAYVVRVVGEDLMPQRFNVWGCKALAGIGHLADTVMDRSIVLELRRKLPHENVERLRHAEPGLFDELAEKLARLADDYKDAVRQARPALPPELHDRAQDNWEPLLAIADVAGGDWPEQARSAALKLSGGDSPTMTTGTELLTDIKAVFEAKAIDRISSHDLIEALCEDTEAPWATYNRGKQVSPRQVAKKLAGYSIAPQTIRIGAITIKGYCREWFDEAFTRYLAPTSPQYVTPSQARQGAALHITDSESRYGNKAHPVTPKPAPEGRCDVVTDTRLDPESFGIVEETF